MVAYTLFWFMLILLTRVNEGMSDVMYNITLVIGVVQSVSYVMVSIKNPGVANIDRIEVDDA